MQPSWRGCDIRPCECRVQRTESVGGTAVRGAVGSGGRRRRREAAGLSRAGRLLKGIDHPHERPISYIEPRDFALALMYEGFEEIPDKNGFLKPKDQLPKSVETLLATLLEGTSGNPAHIQERLESWFRRDQEQLSASYGADSRFWNFFPGTLIAAFFGLDTLALVSQCTLSTCVGLADRFKDFLLNLHKWEDWRMVAGYLLSGLMISQGASFWFGIVTRLTNLRSEGARPR